MYKRVFLLLIIIVFASYKFPPEKDADNAIVINLEHKLFDDEFYIDQEYFYISLGMERYSKYPKYNKYLKENYKGIPENDSVSYYGCFKDGSFLFDLNKSGDLSTENLNGMITGQDIDTLNYSKVKLKATIVAVIGFYKNKQFMIADANKNKDFSDDIKYEYDINFRNNPYDGIDLLNKQPITEYTYEDCYKGNIIKKNRRFIIYPDRNNPFSESSQVNPKKEKEYLSILKFRDYWKGEATIDNRKIEFYYHGYSNKYGILYVKPKEVPYKRNSASFDSQYRFKYYSNDIFDDTISLNGSKYKIDSINRTISKLYLRKLEKKKDNFGHEIGDYVKNIDFEDLESKPFKINSIIEKKNYTLLEFWGTWCGPCVAMTSKLIATQKKYSKTLNIVSIAVDDDKQRVKKYINKHHINWKIGYIPRQKNWKNSTIKQLKIEFFPTFILIDSKGKILSRGASEDFDEMLKLVK